MLVLPLPVSLDPDDGRARQVLMDVVVDGSRRVPMLLDTGTYRSSIPYDAQRIDRCPPGEHSPAGETLVHVDTLCWGDLAGHELTVEMQPEGWNHPALFGMDVLGDHACYFRFTRGRLEVDGPPPSGSFEPLTTPSHRTPVVPVEWADVAITAVWDTGAGITVVDRGWAEAHPDVVSISAEMGRGTDSTGITRSNPKERCRRAGSAL
ncbi:MAG: hypothetical protein ACR2F6_15570 [Mycobacteriales bacterium]